MQLKIKHKLFTAMILANILIIHGIFVLIIWSFDSSFKEYLDASQAEELKPLMMELSELHQSKQSWQWLTKSQDPNWRSLVEKHMRDSSFANKSNRRPPRHRQPPLLGERFNRPPPREGSRQNAKFLLKDSKHQLIIGPPNIDQPKNGEPKNDADINWLSIKSDEQIIGYLGYKRTTEITSELDKIFIDKLKRNIAASAIIIILISAFISLLLSRILVKPILKLRLAANEIVSGNYSAQITISGKDEIAELSSDFNRLASTLKKNLESRQQWIADISHELRTPIAILQGELEAIQDGIREFTPDSVNSLHQEIKRLSYLINDLHELSLSDLGALSYQFETLELYSLIDDVIDSCRDSIEKSKFKVSHNKPNKEVYIKGDINRLTQLFLNLMNNTLAYSDAQGEIDISYHLEQNRLSLTWADTGPGVSDEQLNQLFDRLYRAESSRNRTSGGSGLGLSISKNIIQAHNGQINAKQSKLGGVAIEMKLTTV